MKTTIFNNQKAVLDYLNNLNDNETVNIHNEYCQSCNCSGDEIYNNDEEFFNMFFEGKVLDAVRAVSFGEYEYSHDYVLFNGYGNLVSFNNPSAHIDLSAIAERILENPEDFDIELEDCFELEGVIYEGEEDDAREQYDEYKVSAMDDADDEILSFEEWAKDNLTAVETD